MVLISSKSSLMAFQFYLKLPDDAIVARYIKTNITKSWTNKPKIDEIRGKLSKNIQNVICLFGNQQQEKVKMQIMHK